LSYGDAQKNEQMTHTYTEIQLTTFVDQMFWLIEAQLALMARQLGMPRQVPAAMTPADVVDLLVRATEPGATPNHPPKLGDTRREPVRAQPPRPENRCAHHWRRFR
jgi:hypothetical protein